MYYYLNSAHKKMIKIEKLKKKNQQHLIVCMYKSN